MSKSKEGSYERYQSFYNAEDPARWGRAEMPEQREVTELWMRFVGINWNKRDSTPSVILELGCGVGALSPIHPGYIGLDFSFPALKKVESRVKRINGSMEAIPLCDASVDFIFSWAAIEHVPHPEKVLVEIERVLKPTGVAVLAPAWNVRPWAAKALPIRRYSELSWFERVGKAMIPIRNSLAWRGVFAMPRRFVREFKLLRHTPAEFDYRRLNPTLDRYTYTDCDAFTSMDPHAAIVYFSTRGWRVLSHLSVMSRLLCRHEPVVVQKPAACQVENSLPPGMPSGSCAAI
jgi:ubiquinone/menaquinone biosynthesis C-methylase UbiE